MENNETLNQIPVSSYERLIEIKSKYSMLVDSILMKHNVSLRWDKQELAIKASTEELIMKILKTFEPKRYNQIFEKLIKDEEK